MCQKSLLGDGIMGLRGAGTVTSAFNVSGCLQMETRVTSGSKRHGRRVHGPPHGIQFDVEVLKSFSGSICRTIVCRIILSRKVCFASLVLPMNTRTGN